MKHTKVHAVQIVLFIETTSTREAVIEGLKKDHETLDLYQYLQPTDDSEIVEVMIDGKPV